MSQQNQTARSAVRKNRGATKKLLQMGMMIALSIALVYLIHFPLFPAVAFLEYDPADVPILIGTFAFGPLAGLLLTCITAVIQGLSVSAASGVYGILMHIIATGVLALSAGFIYQRNKTKTQALIGLGIGMLAMAFVMIPANLIITPLFMGVATETVWQLMPFILAFNVLKAGINGAVTFLLYKRISLLLHR